MLVKTDRISKQGTAYHDTDHHLVSSQIISSSSYPIQDGALAVPNNRLTRVALVVAAFRMNEWLLFSLWLKLRLGNHSPCH